MVWGAPGAAARWESTKPVDLTINDVGGDSTHVEDDLSRLGLSDADADELSARPLATKPTEPSWDLKSLSSAATYSS
jgi:hypothetical protein